VVGRGRPSRASVYDRLGRALAELNERYGGLPNPKEAQSIWDDIHLSSSSSGNVWHTCWQCKGPMWGITVHSGS
jgi:hypothetical protein